MKYLIATIVLLFGVSQAYSDTTNQPDEFKIYIQNLTNEVIRVNKAVKTVAYVDEVIDPTKSDKIDCYKEPEICESYPIYPNGEATFVYKKRGGFAFSNESTALKISTVSKAELIGYIQVMFNYPKLPQITKWLETLRFVDTDRFEFLTDTGYGNNENSDYMIKAKPTINYIGKSHGVTFADIHYDIVDKLY